MMGDMVVDEACDEEIAVIIAFLPAQGQALAGPAAGILEQLGTEFAREIGIGLPLIDQDMRIALPLADERAGVMRRPPAR